MEANFHELRHGKTYAHTQRKFGKKRAQAQMEAIALSQARKGPRRHKTLGDKYVSKFY